MIRALRDTPAYYDSLFFFVGFDIIGHFSDSGRDRTGCTKIRTDA